jgi:hypothetical protein
MTYAPPPRPPGYGPPLSAPPSRRHRAGWRAAWILPVGVGVVALVVGISVGAATGKTKKVAGPSAIHTITQTATETVQPSSAVPTVADAPASDPKPADFTIKIKIKRKACFGSAGCNISYQIDPKYHGDAGRW